MTRRYRVETKVEYLVTRYVDATSEAEAERMVREEIIEDMPRRIVRRAGTGRRMLGFAYLHDIVTTAEAQDTCPECDQGLRMDESRHGCLYGGFVDPDRMEA